MPWPSVPSTTSRPSRPTVRQNPSFLTLPSMATGDWRTTMAPSLSFTVTNSMPNTSRRSFLSICSAERTTGSIAAVSHRRVMSTPRRMRKSWAARLLQAIATIRNNSHLFFIPCKVTTFR